MAIISTIDVTNGVGTAGTGTVSTLNGVLGPSTSLIKIKSVSSAPAAIAIKASAGTLKCGVLYCNNPSIPVFMKFYDIAAGSVTVGVSSVAFTIGIAPGAPFNFNLNDGPPFATAISYAITGGIAENDTTAVGVDDLIGTLGYL